MRHTLPGATAAQLTEARNLYAVLVGRVSTYFTNAYQTADGTYKENVRIDKTCPRKNLWFVCAGQLARASEFDNKLRTSLAAANRI